jgi:hypothetical protein
MVLERKGPSSPPALDRELERLRGGAPAFGRAPPADRSRLLFALRRRFHELADRFTDLDCLAKGIPKGSPRAGECRFEGPAVTLHYLTELMRSVGGEGAIDPSGVTTEGGRTRVTALPRDVM